MKIVGLLACLAPLVVVGVMAAGCSSASQELGSNDPHAADSGGGGNGGEASVDVPTSDADLPQLLPIEATSTTNAPTLSGFDTATCGVLQTGALACWGSGPVVTPPTGTFVAV